MSALYFARGRNLAARMIGGEMMVMSGRDSSLFSLNATAAILWEAADGATPLAEVVLARIVPAFDVGREEALRDAEELVRGLAGHGILRLSETPIEP